MCMSPSVPSPPEPEPPKPPPAPAPPPQKSAVERQDSPETPDSGDGDKNRTGRNDLRIPKNRAKGLNLPGANAGGKK